MSDKTPFVPPELGPLNLRPPKAWAMAADDHWQANPWYEAPRDDPLPRALGRAIRLGQGPIRMRLAVLASFKSAKKHERSFTRDGTSQVRIAQNCAMSMN